MIVDDILKTTTVDKLPNDLEGMEASMERLLTLIDDVYKYVDDVVVRSGSILSISFSSALYRIHYIFFYRKAVLHQIITLANSYQILLLPSPKYHHQLLISS